MRRALLLVLVLAAFRSEAQSLVCPPSTATSGKPCDVFHYHVQFYDPDTKGFVTVSGINQFASLSACERAREVRAKQNAAVVDYVKRVKTKEWEADKVGPCHCDLTTHTGSTMHLTDVQRTAQRRSAEDVRRKVRDRLLDYDVPADSELITGLSTVPPVNPLLAGPRLTRVPASVSVAVENKPSDLRMPRATLASTPATASIELPLAEVTSGTAASPAPAPQPAKPPAVESPAAKKSAPEPAAVSLAAEEVSVPMDAAVETPPTSEGVPPAVVPQVEEEAVAAPANSGEPVLMSAEDAADVFIRHEIQRIQNVMQAIPDPPDETGEKVIEACRLRSQVLTNLKYVILGSGARSAVAAAAGRTRDDEARLAFVRSLFGSVVAAHWVPRVTTDVLIPPDPVVDENPERVLRGGGDQFDGEQKRRALYSVLTRESITEDQQLWLISAVEQLLK